MGEQIKHYVVAQLHSAAVGMSADLDALMGVIIVILLFMRLFQLKVAGKAILPMFGVYLILKVLLP